MNDAQTWTAIGGLLAVLFASIGLIIRLLGDTMGARFGSVDDVAAITRRLVDGH